MKKILVCCLTAMVMFTLGASAQTDVTGKFVDSSLEEVLGAVIEEYGGTGCGVNIAYSPELGVYSVTVENGEETIDGTETMSLNANSTWHYAGHAKDTLSAIKLGKTLKKKLSSGHDYMLYLKECTDGGYDVYYKVV